MFLFRTRDIYFCFCAWLLGDGWWGRRRCGLDGRQSFTGVRAIPPNGFIVKDSQMGTLHIFPRTLIRRGDIGTLWEPEQQWFQPESREWCGYVLGNYVWAPGDGAWAPRSIMNSSATNGSRLGGCCCPGYGPGTNAPQGRDRARTVHHHHRCPWSTLGFFWLVLITA